MKIEVYSDNTITTPINDKLEDGKLIPSSMFPATQISPYKGDPKDKTIFLSFMEYDFSSRINHLKSISPTKLKSLSKNELLRILNEPNDDYFVYSSLSKLNEERVEKYTADDLLKINIEDLEYTRKLINDIRNHINNKSVDLIINLDVTKIIRNIEANEENDIEAIRVIKDRYTIDYLYQYLALQYHQILLNNIPITICQNKECSRVFFPLNKGLNEKYCDNIFKNGKTCKEIVPMMNYKKDPLKSYSIRLQDKYRRRKELQEEYNVWKELNNRYIQQYTWELISPEDYEKWLEDSDAIMNWNYRENKKLDYYEPARKDYLEELREKLSRVFRRR